MNQAATQGRGEEGRFDGAFLNGLTPERGARLDAAVISAHGLSQDEYALIVEHLGREPSLVELGVFSVMWSEHCCYKSSRSLLKRLPTEGEAILQGPGENAGAVDLGGGLAAVFKAESHNHPSFVMPYHGAATGVGGILRDIFTLGARPIALLNSLRFGPTSDATTASLFRGVVEGIAGYGNCVGVPTVGGEVCFHSSFARNPLVNVMAVGVAPTDRILLGRAEGPGNPVFVIGAPTGRDGIHGATFASDVMEGDGCESRPQVQIGDPFMGKELIEAVLELARVDYLAGIQDMGAAGLTCSSVEMSARAGTGMVLDLDRVPVREEGMTPYEIMLSESQERMLVVIDRGSEERFCELFRGRGLACAEVGRVAEGGRILIRWHGEVVADMPVDALADGAPILERPAVPKPRPNRAELPMPALAPPVEESLLVLLASENLCSRAWIYDQYDHQVRGDTVVLPGRADAAVLRLRNRQDGLAVTLDGNSLHVSLAPRAGAAATVAEAARNLACTGARPLAVTDCLNFADPGRPEVMWDFAETIEGLREGCLAMDTPVTGGNVSFYNETGELRVLPTPTVGMVGRIADVTTARTMGWIAPGHRVALVGACRGELSGSVYQQHLLGEPSGIGPQLDLEAERALVDFLVESAEARLLRSAHDVSTGGLLVALAECCLASADGLGVVVTDLPEFPEADRQDKLLFGEEGARAVVSYSEKDEGRIRDLCQAHDLPFHRMGETVRGPFVVTDQVELDVERMRKVWEPGKRPAALAWPGETA